MSTFNPEEKGACAICGEMVYNTDQRCKTIDGEAAFQVACKRVTQTRERHSESARRANAQAPHISTCAAPRELWPGLLMYVLLHELCLLFAVYCYVYLFWSVCTSSIRVPGKHTHIFQTKPTVAKLANGNEVSKHCTQRKCPVSF